MESCTVIVKMSDGEKIRIKNAKRYEWLKNDSRVIVCTETGFSQIFNSKDVSYVVREIDLDCKI